LTADLTPKTVNSIPCRREGVGLQVLQAYLQRSCISTARTLTLPDICHDQQLKTRHPPANHYDTMIHNQDTENSTAPNNRDTFVSNWKLVLQEKPRPAWMVFQPAKGWSQEC